MENKWLHHTFDVAGIEVKYARVPKATLLLLHAYQGSWNNAERMYDNGQINDRQWKHFKMFWHWSCLRFSSERQERVYSKMGRDFVSRRIERIKRIHTAYLRELASPYAV